jgi:hypothetical protein
MDVPVVDRQRQRGECGEQLAVAAKERAHQQVDGGDGERARQRRSQPQRVKVEPPRDRADGRLIVGVEHLAPAIRRQEQRAIARQHLAGVDGVEGLVELGAGRDDAKLVEAQRAGQQRNRQQIEPIPSRHSRRSFTRRLGLTGCLEIHEL